MKFFLKCLWCSIFHKKYFSWINVPGGDWAIQRCSKCNQIWTVPKTNAIGDRVVI